MPLATKNNALIVKDGKVAENCGCCGGWYCCTPAIDSPCRVDETVQSINVTVTTGQDNVVVGDKVESNVSCYAGGPVVTLYTRIVAIIQASHYSGSFSLSRQSANSWAYSYPADTPGNIATITAEFVFGLWSFQLSFHSYAWRKISRNPISETKTISDMLRFGGGNPSDALQCFEPPEELYFRRFQSFGFLLPMPCAGDSLSGGSSGVLQSSFYEQDWAGYTTSSQSGASSISMSASLVSTL